MTIVTPADAPLANDPRLHSGDDRSAEQVPCVDVIESAAATPVGNPLTTLTSVASPGPSFVTVMA
jgi:hypothetical protein